ncbi:ABC transporter ATP-binding protein [Chitinophaga japonensis]|uniref:Putative ABC transport system ATP-binding protein n=1 Tax=Chitinophaga japonensis TaxID=104662 RepID=A0A562TDD0_CHIJA|nr:ATP-binding cassette domain-containing protein [Chitinophaga japonensis]TWI91512.1 putative ABC transport system ATP-binding protein [Chitinophaga japonensis]
MLQTTHLQYHYGQRAFTFPPLQCSAGEVLLITGPSGSGKTTLLHLLAGLLLPDAGEIRIDDTVINNLPVAQMDRFRGRHIGIVYQQSHFMAALTVRDNLLLAARLARQPAASKQVAVLARALGIHQLLRQYPARLSQGEQQRVSIARALLPAPPLILADEPTASLDDDNCMAVARLLQQQARQQQAALVIVTHDNRLKALFHQQTAMPEPQAGLAALPL